MVKESENNGVMIGGPGFAFRKYEHRTKWQRVKLAIYDPSTKEFLGRTGKSWGQLLIFYTLFYIVLAAMFAVCMKGLFATLSDEAPRWQLDSSLIGSNPGLGFRPISSNTAEGSIISYNLKNESTITKWINNLDGFLEPYKISQTGSNFQPCSFEKYPDEGKVCTVDLEKFGSCGPAENYGYNNNTSSPCVFLKLNKIYGWTPDCYTEPDDNMPQELKEVIAKEPTATKNQVWISCEGEHAVDKEHVTQFKYFPNRGFASYYYPYKNVKNYLSPLIAVQIVNPKPNVLISIECRAWAKNIQYRGGMLAREGSVQFDIMLDNV